MKQASPQKKPDRYQQMRRSQELVAVEEEIEALEARLTALEEELLEASRRGDGKRIAEFGDEHRSLTRSIAARYAQWERLSAQHG